MAENQNITLFLPRNLRRFLVAFLTLQIMQILMLPVLFFLVLISIAPDKEITTSIIYIVGGVYLASLIFGIFLADMVVFGGGNK